MIPSPPSSHHYYRNSPSFSTQRGGRGRSRRNLSSKSLIACLRLVRPSSSARPLACPRLLTRLTQSFMFVFVLTFFLLRVRSGGVGRGSPRRRRRRCHRDPRWTGRLCPCSRWRRLRWRFLVVLDLHRPRLELHLECQASSFALRSKFCDDFNYYAIGNSTIAII